MVRMVGAAVNELAEQNVRVPKGRIEVCIKFYVIKLIFLPLFRPSELLKLCSSVTAQAERISVLY